MNSLSRFLIFTFHNQGNQIIEVIWSVDGTFITDGWVRFLHKVLQNSVKLLCSGHHRNKNKFSAIEMCPLQMDHSFSTYENFPKNELFLLPDTHTHVCVWGGKKCSFFGKFCVLIKWMIPKEAFHFSADFL